MRRPKLRRPQRDTRPRPLSLLRDSDDDTRPIPRQDRYQTAPVGPAPARRFAHQDESVRYQIDLYDVPGPIPADQIDERCRDALDCLRLKFKHLWREQMLFRVDEAERVRLRGEPLPPGERVITEYRQESAAHLLGSREPWQPGPYTPPQPEPPAYAELVGGPWYHPQDPSGVRAAYDRAFNGNGAA